MSKKKIIMIAAAAILVLAAIGSGMSQNGGQTTASSTSQKSEQQTATTETKAPTVKVDAVTDLVKVNSYTVDDTGVTVDVSFDNGKQADGVNVEVTRFKYGDKDVNMIYDKSTDKYAANGVTFTEGGKVSEFGSFFLNSGSSTTLKFSVDGFTKASDYDGFAVYFDLKYSGSFTGEIKDDYIKFSVS